ncbi:MAG: tRNA (adenosine(37)-N6)-threonylcarbamoyltransferase complex dimerization subunit type 1 TsaB [bacterium]|nr:tRNA (adenosine(37)-N6)-threonylcarbamoyltransferase complex dimerization subunit type 1 TsaB [bacterium]
MFVLGVESATAQLGVAIGGPEGVIASFHSNRQRRHAETLVPAIDFLCWQTRIDLDEIGVVAVDVGPGLFTGLRVGLATAKAIAHARRIPMIGVSSLDLVAFPARITDRLVVATIDARRDEVYYASYRGVRGEMRRITEPRVDPPGAVADQLRALGEDCLVVGDGAQRYADVFREVGRVEIAREGFRFPDAGSLVELAIVKALREEFVPESMIEPLYLRAPDAHLRRQDRESG